jgi:hypothetical protein
LAFSGGEGSGTQVGLVAAEALNEHSSADGVDCLVDLGGCGVATQVVGEVLGDGAGEDVGFLRDEHAPLGEVSAFPIAQFDTVEEYLTGLWFEDAGNDSGKGGLADATGPDDGEVVVLSQQQVEVADDWFSVPAITEGDVTELKGMVGRAGYPSRRMSC